MLEPPAGDASKVVERLGGLANAAALLQEYRLQGGREHDFISAVEESFFGCHQVFLAYLLVAAFHVTPAFRSTMILIDPTSLA